MNIYAPDYYNEFRCIADKCAHNCCIGWEIDIDGDTYEKYRCVCGEFGDRLKSNISTEGETHFILADKDRCPFLNENNLCDIIINLGEDHLCGICNDHPRYRNFFSDREESGLGLCCEAAAELILNRMKKTEFIKLCGDDEVPDDDEKEFFKERDEILSIVQDRELATTERIEKLMGIYNISIPYATISTWAEFLKGLERLDTRWDNILGELDNNTPIAESLSSENDIMNEQMLIYFIHRHLADGIYDASIRERLAFAIVSVMLINAISLAVGEKFTEIARIYSSEIEYCEENMEAFFEILNEI